MLRVLSGIALGCAVVAVYVASLYFRADKEMSAYDAQDAAMQAYYEKEVAKADAQRALEAQDTYGGKTPQETWQMFIEALKKGDTDLAAKYFVVDLQKKKADFFRRAHDAGVLETKLLPIYQSATQEHFSADMNFFELSTASEEGGEGSLESMPFVFLLRRVEPQGLWKIYEL